MQVLKAIANAIFSKQDSFTMIIVHSWVLLQIYWLEEDIWEKKTHLLLMQNIFSVCPYNTKYMVYFYNTISND